eukprot:384698-Alexandrium_andersonii.AAC.1
MSVVSVLFRAMLPLMAEMFRLARMESDGAVGVLDFVVETGVNPFCRAIGTLWQMALDDNHNGWRPVLYLSLIHI